jgi:glycosyltransferase involved in cell wall biosynthesis
MIIADKYPRVLVVNGGPFERQTNHGIVMSSLFQDWPKDRLAQIDFAQSRDPEFDVCEQYWRVTRAQIFKCLMGKRVSGIVKPSEYARVSPESQSPINEDIRTPFERWLRKNISSFQIRTALNELIYRLPAVLSPSLRSWIDRFQPDLAFSMLGSGSLLFTNLKISKLWNIPCVPYFTDDWISWLYGNHFLAFWLRTKLVYLFKEYLSRSPIGITVSNEMANEYASRYGGSFSPVLYPFDPPQLAESSQKYNSAGRMKFIYLGGLEPDRWQSLQMLGKALAKLDEEGIRAELLVYTFPHDIEKYGDKLQIENVSRVMGTALPSEVPGIQQSADVLIHVESFDKEAKKKTRLSFSTKIPQYLSTKKCVLAFGPLDVASMRYLADNHAAFIVSENDLQHLISELKSFISDQGLQKKISECGYRIAQANHNGDWQRERLRCQLVEICRTWKKRS